jgi:hypothetical protein
MARSDVEGARPRPERFPRIKAVGEDGLSRPAEFQFYGDRGRGDGGRVHEVRGESLADVAARPRSLRCFLAKAMSEIASAPLETRANRQSHHQRPRTGNQTCRQPLTPELWAPDMRGRRMVTQRESEPPVWRQDPVLTTISAPVSGLTPIFPLKPPFPLQARGARSQEWTGPVCTWAPQAYAARGR